MTIDKPYQLCISSNIIIAFILLFQRLSAGKKLQVAEDQELEDCLLEICIFAPLATKQHIHELPFHSFKVNCNYNSDKICQKKLQICPSPYKIVRISMISS